MESNEMDRCIDILVEKLKKDNETLRQQISSYEAWRPNSWNSNLQIESLKKENVRLNKECDMQVECSYRYHSQVEELKKALQFYAEPSTYDREHLSQYGHIVIDYDNGEKARHALKEVFPHDEILLLRMD